MCMISRSRCAKEGPTRWTTIATGAPVPVSPESILERYKEVRASRPEVAMSTPPGCSARWHAAYSAV